MNKYYFFKTIVTISWLFLLSCDEASDKNESKVFLDVAEKEIIFTPGASQRTIFVNTNKEFSAISSDPSWCMISPTEVSVIINVPANDAVGESRTAEITITCENLTHTITVIQQGVEATIQVDKTNVLISVIRQYQDDNLDFNLDVNSNISIIFELPNWISDDGDNTTVLGQKKYSFRATPLPEAIDSRSGEIVIKSTNVQINKSQKITVVQNLSKWELVWEDDFNTATLNTNIWNKRWQGTAAWARYMASHEGLHEVKDGNLILRGVKNTTNPGGDNRPYFTGGVCTRWNKYFGLGKIEIRAKIESAQGAWPALWMVPETEVPWPVSGEIDIMEHLNFDNYVFHTVHTNYTRNLGQYTNPPYQAITHVDVGEFNVYGVAIYSDSLVFSVNNARTFVYPRLFKPEEDKDGQFPFDRYPQFLLMTMQLGGADTWPGVINDNHLPVAMYIDWVRYYELK